MAAGCCEEGGCVWFMDLEPIQKYFVFFIYPQLNSVEILYTVVPDTDSHVTCSKRYKAFLYWQRLGVAMVGNEAIVSR